VRRHGLRVVRESKCRDISPGNLTARSTAADTCNCRVLTYITVVEGLRLAGAFFFSNR